VAQLDSNWVEVSVQNTTLLLHEQYRPQTRTCEGQICYPSVVNSFQWIRDSVWTQCFRRDTNQTPKGPETDSGLRRTAAVLCSVHWRE